MKFAIQLLIFSVNTFTLTVGQDAKCPPEGIANFPLEDCTKYLKCTNGESLEVLCPEGSFFNPEVKHCDVPLNDTECVTRKRVGQTTDCPSDGIAYLHHSECNKFVICRIGVGAEMTCPHSLYYNPETTRCDYPKNVDASNCKVGTEPPTVTETTQSSGEMDSSTNPYNNGKARSTNDWANNFYQIFLLFVIYLSDL